MLWGIVLSIAIFGIYAFLALQESCSVKECQRNWARFIASPPNEIGDTLAGLSGGLAFLWIIVAVFLQGQELREQRKELALTREELRLAREAQEQQLLVMQKQADIFEDEKRRRDQDATRRYTDRNLKSLRGLLSNQSLSTDHLLFNSLESLSASGNKCRSWSMVNLLDPRDSDDEEFLVNYLRQMESNARDLDLLAEESQSVNLPDNFMMNLNRAIAASSTILSEGAPADSIERARTEFLRIGELHGILVRVATCVRGLAS